MFRRHVHALALYFAFYNIVRIHKTLRMTPADSRGDHGSPLHGAAPKPGKRGPYKKHTEIA